MSEGKRWVGSGLVALLVPVLAALTPALANQQLVGTTVSLGADEASLQIDVAGGRGLEISLADGRIYVNGSAKGSYSADGALEQGWRRLLEAAKSGPDALRAAWSEFTSANYEGADREGLAAIRAAIAPVLAGQGTVPSETTAAAPAKGPRSTAPSQATPQESVSGGLVVELSHIQGANRTLRRLAPGLPHDLQDALKAPLRVVVDADQYRLPEGAQVGQSLLLVDTDSYIAGTVEGDVIVADGSLRLASSAHVTGNVISLDADIDNQGASIGGQIRTVEDMKRAAKLRVAPIRIERRIMRSPLHYLGRGLGDLLQTIASYIVFAFLGVLLVYFFRGHLENVSDTVAHSFGRSFLAGLAAQVLFFPVLLVLVVLVLTWLAIPFYVLAYTLACIFGYLAVAHAAGENLTRRRYSSWPARLRRANSYYYILNGLLILLGLFAVGAVAEIGGPLLGWVHGLLAAAACILTWVAVTAGMGAVLLSRAGTRRNFARPREVPDLGDLMDEAADIGSEKGREPEEEPNDESPEDDGRGKT